VTKTKKTLLKEKVKLKLRIEKLGQREIRQKFTIKLYVE